MLRRVLREATSPDSSHMSSVDVIVPCFRYAHFLQECVASILSQSGVALRVLIIDDASPDNTEEVAKELVDSDPRVHYRKHAVNQGLIATANEGMRWATAAYTLLLSADDYLLPGALSRSVDLMDRHPSVAFVFGGAIALNQHGERSSLRIGIGCKTHILSGLEFVTLNRAKNLVASPTAVVRTSLQQRLGGYLADLPHTSDMEMWLRLAAHGDVGVIAADQAVYRVHTGNMSSGFPPEQDLLQRKAAIAHFLDGGAAKLANRDELRGWLARHLALDAIKFASIVFNEGAMESSARLCKLALTIDPAIRGTRRWWFLTSKRIVGRRAWQRVSPAANWFRSFSRSEDL